jgi:hypothetical protein
MKKDCLHLPENFLEDVNNPFFFELKQLKSLLTPFVIFSIMVIARSTSSGLRRPSQDHLDLFYVSQIAWTGF